MNKFIRWTALIGSLVLCTPHSYAQKAMARLAPIALSNELPALAGSFVSTQAKSLLGQEITSALTRQTAIYESEKAQVAAALLKMESAVTQGNPLSNHFQANAFLIETKYKGKKEVWGVTAAELVHGYGKDLVLRTEINGQEISFPAQMVEQGPYALSNIALLRVPQNLPKGLKPLKLHTEYDFNEPVSIFGYNKGKFTAIQNLNLQKDNGLFMRMDLSQLEPRETGPFGGPVLSQGKLVGVYCNRSYSGGYASSIRALPFLIEAQHKGSTEFPLQMHDVLFGKIHHTEVILMIQGLDIVYQPIVRKIATNQLHQSEVFKMFNNPDVRYLTFLLEDRKQGPFEVSDKPARRILVYDKYTKASWYQELPTK